ncbi:MAG TPA: tetratricopeptide repeat protein [Thermoanaerobaculia bacterium]|nr:tetratricopeptide repeat protein [Thermoanaerobaculia bacterium]
MTFSRLLRTLALLLVMGAATYLMISLVAPSSRRLVYGIDRRTGIVRTVRREIAFLPPHEFFLLSFDRRDDRGGSAQYDGVIRVFSKDGTPVAIEYRLCFGLAGGRIIGQSSLIEEGWNAWIRSRVSEAANGVAQQIANDDLISPGRGFDAQRDLFRGAVTAHLATSGLVATAFEIARIDVDRNAIRHVDRTLASPTARAISDSPLAAAPSSAHAWYNNNGAGLRGKRRIAEAEQSARKAIEIDPGPPAPYFNLAVILVDRQQYDAADAAFLQSMAHGLGAADRHLADFAALYRQRSLAPRAVALLIKGRELFPGSALIAADLGASLADAGRDAEAIPELERALALEPTSTQTLNNLGLVYANRNEYARALDYWNRSLSIDPRQPQIREVVRAVRARL